MINKSIRDVCHVTVAFQLTMITLKGTSTHINIYWILCTESRQNECPVIAV